MFLRVSSVPVLFAFIVLLAGCSSAPEAEQKAAEDAMARAKAAEADQYASGVYQAAVDSLYTARVELQKQNAKSALWRRYGHSRGLFSSARTLADQAASEAKTDKAKVGDQISILLNQADSLSAVAASAVAKASEGRETKAKIKLMQANLSSIRQVIATAHSDFRVGNYRFIRAKVDASMTQLNRVIDEAESVSATGSGKH